MRAFTRYYGTETLLNKLRGCMHNFVRTSVSGIAERVDRGRLSVASGITSEEVEERGQSFADDLGLGKGERWYNSERMQGWGVEAWRITRTGIHALQETVGRRESALFAGSDVVGRQGAQSSRLLDSGLVSSSANASSESRTFHQFQGFEPGIRNEANVSIDRNSPQTFPRYRAMVGFAAVARQIVLRSVAPSHPSSDWYSRTIFRTPRANYATRAKLQERRSLRGTSAGDSTLPWYDSVDRHVPWPDKRAKSNEKDKKKHTRSFKLRCEKYLKPFTLDIFISNRFVHASIMHRALHKVVAVANSNAKEFRGTLPSYGDIRACWVIGKVLADRAKEADVFTVVYIPRRGEKLDNRMMTIVDTLVDNGIALELDKTT